MKNIEWHKMECVVGVQFIRQVLWYYASNNGTPLLVGDWREAQRFPCAIATKIARDELEEVFPQATRIFMNPCALLDSDESEKLLKLLRDE